MQENILITTPKEIIKLTSAIDNLNKKVDDLEKNYQPKVPPKFVTRNYVADEMLHCNISTVHNLTVKKVLSKYQIGGRVLYVRQEVEEAIVRLKK